MTGLAHARGELVFLIDCDLEEDPAWLLTFHDAMRADHVDVVYGVQAERKGDWSSVRRGGCSSASSTGC